MQGVDASPVQLGLPLQVLGLLREVRFGGLNLAFGHVDLGLKVCRVDLKEQVALVHRLIVPDPHADDRAGNPRGDADDIGADLAISRPGILQVAVVEGDGRPNRQAQQGNGDEGFDQLRLHGKKPRR